jgi:hypothetical protein
MDKVAAPLGSGPTMLHMSIDKAATAQLAAAAAHVPAPAEQVQVYPDAPDPVVFSPEHRRLFSQPIDAADAGEPSWVGTFRDNERAVHGREVSAGGLYVGALYWSIMTITSIGYGDITPKNDTERAVCCLLMIISGATWAFVIAEAAGIAATLDPNGAAFRNSMDALNVYMRERKLDSQMRHVMRDFFSDARAVNQAESDGSLLSQLSPMLQGKVELAASTDWLSHGRARSDDR